MTTIVLVRHGETDWNADDRCQGSIDVPMNARGRAQADELALTLRDIHFDAAYTSPLSRARDTAAAILAGSALGAIDMPDLSELCYGTLQGLTFAEWPADVRATWAETPWAVIFPGGESLSMVRVRVARALRRLLETHRGQTVLVASHGHANRVMLIEATAVDPEQFWGIAQPNGCAYRLTYDSVARSWTERRVPRRFGRKVSERLEAVPIDRGGPRR